MREITFPVVLYGIQVLLSSFWVQPGWLFQVEGIALSHCTMKILCSSRRPDLFSCCLRDGEIPSDSLFHWLRLSHSSCLTCCLPQCLCCCCPLGSQHAVFWCWLTHLPFLFPHSLTCMFLFPSFFSHLIFIYPNPPHPYPGNFFCFPGSGLCTLSI